MQEDEFWAIEKKWSAERGERWKNLKRRAGKRYITYVSEYHTLVKSSFCTVHAMTRSRTLGCAKLNILTE